MQSSRFKSLLCIFLFYPVSFLYTQTKTLDWDEIKVDAFLQADGSLDVFETQKIRFSGDWNGAYRRFQVGWGQKLAFYSVERKGKNGQWILLKSGNTNFTDSYIYQPLDHEVKWRARMSTDPAFNNDILEYRIHVKYLNILTAREAGLFELNHEFSFSDRKSDIAFMQVNLNLDSKWNPIGKMDPPLVYRSSSKLSPSDSMIVRLDVKYLGDPTHIRANEKLPFYIQRILCLFGVLFLLAMINFLIYLHARKIGAMDEPKRLETWKEFHEILENAKPEYLAILAESGVANTWMTRLLFEGKISTDVSIEGKPVLRKLVGDSQFDPIDQSILKRLFVNEKSVISSEEIREYYRKNKRSYSLGADIEQAYSTEMEALGYTSTRNSIIERTFAFLVDKVLFTPIYSVPILICAGLIYYSFLSEPLQENGVGYGRFLLSILFTFVGAFVVSTFEDVHYGFDDLTLFRDKYFIIRYLRSLVPGFIFCSFYLWSLEIHFSFILLSLGILFFLSLQHLVRLAPQSHIRQIRSTLRVLALKNFLYLKLLSKEKCDIPRTFAPLVPALDLTHSIKYRRENLHLDDVGYLQPENFQQGMEVSVQSPSTSAPLSSSRNSIVSGGEGSSSFSGLGGSFGGAGMSASWSDMENFSSSSSYSTPSSNSSSSSSSSSGGGGGGGW